jgi:hypothetical protein
MRFFQVVFSGAALVAAAWAVELNQVPSALVAGQTYTITYSPKDNTPTTFILRKGDPGNLGTVGTIGTATGGTFVYTVPTDLVDADNYAFEVQQAGQAPNYSGLIPLTGGSGKSSSSSYVASSTSSSSELGYPTLTLSSSSSSSASATTTPTETITATPILPSGVPSGTGYISVPGLNSTITTATLSRTSGSSTPTSPSGPPAEQTNAASLFGSSPLAILVGAAAMVYLN